MSRAPWVLPKPERAFPAGDRRGLHDAGLAAGQRPDDRSGRSRWARPPSCSRDVLRSAGSAGRLRCARTRRPPGLDRRGSTTTSSSPARGGAHPRRVHPARHDPGEARRAETVVPQADGTVTAGNSSPLNDGASAVLLGSGHPPKRSSPAAAGPHRRPRGGRERPAVLRIRTGRGRQQGAQARAGIGWADVGAVELNEASPPSPSPASTPGRSTPTSSTHTAAPSPSATRSARPAPACSARSPARCGRPASGAASPRSASASGRRSPWSSRTWTLTVATSWTTPTAGGRGDRRRRHGDDRRIRHGRSAGPAHRRAHRVRAPRI